jgi:hypothetical protein
MTGTKAMTHRQLGTAVSLAVSPPLPAVARMLTRVLRPAEHTLTVREGGECGYAWLACSSLTTRGTASQVPG